MKKVLNSILILDDSSVQILDAKKGPSPDDNESRFWKSSFQTFPVFKLLHYK